jgi:nitroreductase
MDAIEAMSQSRAIRYFKPDPVSEELIERVLWAATRATSPENSQCWDFVVVQDTEQRVRLQQCFVDFDANLDAVVASESTPVSTMSRTVAGVKHLVGHFADVPVWIFVTGWLSYPQHNPRPRYTYSAMYAAAQNLLVAATSLGLASAFTTLHELDERGFRKILGIPDDHLFGVSMPLGWPDRGVGPVNRRPLQDVVHRNRW